MRVPADLEGRASAFVGVPFLAKGRDPAGWDCIGCARWLLAEICGVETPDYAGRYAANAVRPGGAPLRARLLADELATWSTARARPGAIVRLRWFGHAGHVGLMLTERRFIHADQGVDTVIADLDDPEWRDRGAGFFLPRSVP